MTNQREAFEQWVSSPPHSYIADRWPDDATIRYVLRGRYKSSAVQRTWEAWQESRQQAMTEAINIPTTL